MVELLLEGTDPSQLTKDLFVSVRVGEAQKLAKASAGGRQFKFPEKAFANRKFGKLELFRHIGSCTFAASETFRDSTQDLSMCCEDGRDNVRFRITMGSGAKAPEPPSPVRKEQGSNSAAKAYLEAHQLELRMSEAMDLLLHEKPEDPAAFIYERLRRNKDMLSVAEQEAPMPTAQPAVVKGSPAVAEAPPPPAKNAGSVAEARPLPAKSAVPLPRQAPACEELRRETHKALIAATHDGRLQSILQASDRESRSVDASADGVLAACLAEAAKPAEDQSSASDLNALRSEASQALLCAANDGRLENSLIPLKGSAPVLGSKADPELSVLRDATTKALVAASGDGSLERILGTLQVAEPWPAQAQSQPQPQPQVAEQCAAEAPDISDDIRQALLHASADGSLHRLIEAVRPETPGPIPAIDPFRMDTCRTLKAALKDGRLERAVLAFHGPEAGVRIDACQALVGAIHDGRLEMALQATTELQDDALQRCLGEKLQAAVEDGRLRAALESSNGA